MLHSSEVNICISVDGQTPSMIRRFHLIGWIQGRDTPLHQPRVRSIILDQSLSDFAGVG
jgi:ribulose kinase